MKHGNHGNAQTPAFPRIREKPGDRRLMNYGADLIFSAKLPKELFVFPVVKMTRRQNILIAFPVRGDASAPSWRREEKRSEAPGALEIIGDGFRHSLDSALIWNYRAVEKKQYVFHFFSFVNAFSRRALQSSDEITATAHMGVSVVFGFIEASARHFRSRARNSGRALLARVVIFRSPFSKGFWWQSVRRGASPKARRFFRERIWRGFARARFSRGVPAERRRA